MKTLIISMKIFLFFTLLTGLVYPLAITVIAQLSFPAEANGSIVVIENRETGSALIGQHFDSLVYFSSRPSAVSYNTLPSGGSNLGLTNKALRDLFNQRKLQFIENNELDSNAYIPSEMLFASASGLDPHISTRAALLQIDRIAKARNFNSAQKQKLMECISDLTEPPQFFFLGEPRINVLILNLEADKLK